MKTDKIIIVGGGSAGWMTAATLISQFPQKDITVIESPDTPTVGVGESTLGQINRWLDLLGIKDEDFMPHTDASYKLSIRFEDFYQKGDGGFHYPFGKTFENNLNRGKQSWFIKKFLYPETPYTNYADFVYPNMSLVNNNRITKNEYNTIPGFRFKNDVAYHFDAAKFGLWLREYYCKPKGVNHILEDIKTIQQNEDGIYSLNNNYEADFYIDCTGFKSLLLGQTLKEPFDSYEHILPNNSAWATRVPYRNKEEELQPYTNCTAIENGWVWNIPSWERIGTGYVYSNKYVSDEEALNQFKRHLDKKGSDYSKSEFKNIKMRVGLHKRLFVKNVCAIGLSAGFIEPLESNGLLSVHEFLINLVKILTRGGNISQWDRDSFNLTCKEFFEMFTEFVAVHYAFSHRDDTQYWKDISKKSFLNIKLCNEGLYLDIKAKMNEGEYFKSTAGLHCITTGMRYGAFDVIDIKLGNMINDEIKSQIRFRDQMVEKWNNIAKLEPTLLQFLKDNIHKNA